jgi:hypothetical protein
MGPPYVVRGRALARYPTCQVVREVPCCREVRRRVIGRYPPFGIAEGHADHPVWAVLGCPMNAYDGPEAMRRQNQ